MRKVGLIGFGAIGTTIVKSWRQHLDQRETLCALLVRPHQMESASAQVNRETLVTDRLEEFLKLAPDVVVEAASHGAIAECAEGVLEQGCTLHVLSVGALADDNLRRRVARVAERCGGRIVIPAGALAGFDGLLSLRTAGLTAVNYSSVKPIDAWRATAAEDVCCLDNLAECRVIFDGTAKEAAILYPRNANLAAAVALAGIGFENTHVQLLADPRATENSARIEAFSPAGKLDVTLRSAGFAENPKTSGITAMSVIAALLRGTDSFVFT